MCHKKVSCEQNVSGESLPMVVSTPNLCRGKMFFQNKRLSDCFFTKSRCVENMLMKAVVAVGHGSCCKQHKLFQQPFVEDFRGQSFCSCLVIGMFLLVGVFSSHVAHRSPAGCLSGWCEIKVPCVVFLSQRDRDWSMTTHHLQTQRSVNEVHLTSPRSNSWVCPRARSCCRDAIP